MKNSIKNEREKQGLSQTELSIKAGVSRTLISGLESGRVTVTTTETIEKIANALNRKITDIFF